MHPLNNKVPPPLVVIICTGLMSLVTHFAPQPALMLPASVHGVLIAALLSVAGFFMLSGVLRFKRASTTIDPRNPDAVSSLVTGGVYQYSRNPMYLGMALILSAWGLYLLSVWGFLGVAGFVWYINRFQIGPEEQALKRLFGDDFLAYCEKTRRWI